MKQILDVRGAKCPVPIVKARIALGAMVPGDLLEVVSTDPGSLPDFRGWASTSKLAILREQRTIHDDSGAPMFVHLLERKG